MLLLGGNHPNALLELHDICFTLASDQKQAFQNASTKWFGDLSTAHVDAWQELSTVDGHRLCSKEESEKFKKLYFINVGGYVDGVFNEDHTYLFLIGTSLSEVKKRAKEMMKSKRSLAHIDNADSVEQIIHLQEVDGEKLYWQADAKAKNSSVHLGYWPYRQAKA